VLPTLQFIANHPLSSRRPLGAYWRYARWQIESRLRREVIYDWMDGAKLVARNGMTGATGNIYCGLHEFADMAFLLHLLRPGDLFVDVGANIGSYTILASAVCGARSVAIEPDPASLRALARNIEINGIAGAVRVVEAAASGKAGKARFSVGLDTVNHIASHSSGETREVDAICLDDLLADADPVLIKMDVEGHEPEVVSGARQTLVNPSLSAVITETADQGMQSILNSFGFERAYYQPFSRALQFEHPRANDEFARNALFVRRGPVGDRLRTAPYRRIAGIRI
jgi:FkbM family methyltransferase